ncbi:MFS transporter [Phyllobacterium sp. YR531]|uniref:MFS transporter n=1 Tax=Phyllobacterium sp. YR531 TaxID=1144343 RepID=UPI00026F7EE4|nr:MFS transporter [Phyllobacterium sp. YR531]EJM98916.1 arabinose efflux permease family protein [Phyllobacterium sp. YR531]
MTTANLPDSESTLAVRGTSIPRTVWILGIVSLLMDVSSEMIQTLLPFYLVSSLGASAVLVGFIEGLSVAIATATKLVSGVVSDWTGRRKPLAVLGYGLGALSKLIFPLAVSVGWIVAAKSIDRVGKGIRGTPRDALIADVTPPELRGASFGLRKSLDTVGGFIGPLIAIALMFAFDGNILAVYWLAIIPAGMAMVLLVVGIREPKSQSAQSTPAIPRLADIILLNRAVWVAIGLASLLTLARFSEAFLLLKSQEAGFTPAWIPITMVIMHAVYGLTAYPVGRLSDKIGRSGLLVGSIAVLATAYIVLAAASSIGIFILGIVLWGLHMGLSQGLLATLIADTAPKNLKGTAFGVFNLITGVVVLVGNVAAGWVWDAHGSSTTFFMGAAVSTAAMLVVGAMSLRRKMR